MREIEIELHEASANNNILAVEILLKNKDIDVNLSNILGLTPLTHASKSGYKEIVELLLKAGADPNKLDQLYITPLMNACANGHTDIVEILIKNGASINLSNCNSETPLHYACSENYFDIIKILIENGADVNAKTDTNVTPLMYSCQKSNFEAVKFLIEHNANIADIDNDFTAKISNTAKISSTITDATNTAAFIATAAGTVYSPNAVCVESVEIRAIAASGNSILAKVMNTAEKRSTSSCGSKSSPSVEKDIFMTK